MKLSKLRIKWQGIVIIAIMLLTARDWTTNIMICILAGNLVEAQRWARSQFLDDNEWIYPEDEEQLHKMTNFHVVIVGTAGMNVPSSYFDRLLTTAKNRGRIGRT